MIVKENIRLKKTMTLKELEDINIITHRQIQRNLSERMIYEEFSGNSITYDGFKYHIDTHSDAHLNLVKRQKIKQIKKAEKFINTRANIIKNQRFITDFTTISPVRSKIDGTGKQKVPVDNKKLHKVIKSIFNLYAENSIGTTGTLTLIYALENISDDSEFIGDHLHFCSNVSDENLTFNEMTYEVKKLLKESLGTYYHDTDNPLHKDNTCKRIRYDKSFGNSNSTEAVEYLTKGFNNEWSINDYGIYIK